MWWGLRARPPSIDDRLQIVHVDEAAAINISIRIITAPSLKNSKQVMDGDEAVAVDVRADRTLATDGVAAVVDPAAIDLIRIVPAHHRIRQRGAAVVIAVDPAARAASGVV